MFNENANTTFNNKVFSTAIISGMPPDIHATMARLYQAAKELRPPIEGQSDLARALNVSPQVVNNWEERGISKDGAITAQQLLGINAVWIRKNEGPPLKKAALFRG
jgi:DNA-binding XRE family transcriptional regulator